MKNRVCICAVLMIAGVILTTVSARAELKEGWSQLALDSTTSGCITAIVAPQVEIYKQKVGYKGNDAIPPEFEKVLPILKKEIQVLCSCITDKIANIWSFQEVMQLNINNDPAINKLMETAIITGECPLPFYDASKRTPIAEPEDSTDAAKDMAPHTP